MLGTVDLLFQLILIISDKIRRVYIALCFMNFYIIRLILIEVYTWRNLYH